ncbi:hypothetical protein RND81_14G105000 [Saponaria officinalis]|uniref:Fcf2 pre-rRNA processing C-terminal domain-containing protein n=1 Tax=Saponaria officinalis TaxID=3572 RepID=A0AAW1GNP6_SAPOF
MDPKRHYKNSDTKLKTLPKYFKMGIVVQPASEYFSGRLTKKERKSSLAEELFYDRERSGKSFGMALKWLLKLVTVTSRLIANFRHIFCTSKSFAFCKFGDGLQAV